MPEKSDKEIAAELTIAMLNHNASLHNGIVGQGQGQSKGNICLLYTSPSPRDTR